MHHLLWVESECPPQANILNMHSPAGSVIFGGCGPSQRWSLRLVRWLSGKALAAQAWQAGSIPEAHVKLGGTRQQVVLRPLHCAVAHAPTAHLNNTNKQMQFYKGRPTRSSKGILVPTSLSGPAGWEEPLPKSYYNGLRDSALPSLP